MLAGPSNLVEPSVPFALATDPGTERPQNEDACGSYTEGSQVLVVVADGVSGEEGGEIASRTAVDVTLRVYRESPVSWGPSKRLYRAVQQANIEIHDRALVVTELRGMATTLTAIVVDGGMLYAAHVGDTRLYLVRAGAITQKTKDHTVAAGRQRIGLLSAARASQHPGRAVLTRSLGRELIAAVDRIEFPIANGDVLLVCSDGLYNALDDEELRETMAGKNPESACSALIQRANHKGTADNLTCAVATIASVPVEEEPSAWRAKLSQLLGRRI
jgi:protein phosphatase